MTHIGYKKCDENKIVELEILGENNENRKDMYDKNFAKMRCSKAKVLRIYNMFDEKIEYNNAMSMPIFTHINIPVTYIKGEIVHPDSFDPNIDKVCSNGIHYFLTKEVAFHFGMIDYDGYTGKVKRYYDNGRVRSSAHYVNGMLDGEITEYYENGRIKIHYTYRDGRNGEFTKYFDNGKLKLIDDYTNGKINGESRTYFYSGQLKSVGYHVDGKPDGEFVFYNKNGTIFDRNLYKNGVMVSKPVKCQINYHNPVYQRPYIYCQHSYPR